MSQPTALDLRVTIDCVRVRTAAPAGTRARPVFVTGSLGDPASAPLHDHRVVIHELRIDVAAALDAASARSLGAQVASELARRLTELQDRRQPRIANQPSSFGPIYVETLHLYLQGEPARHPPSHLIATALMDAFEERVRDAS